MYFDFELLLEHLNAMIFECALCTIFDRAAVFTVMPVLLIFMSV